MSLFWLVGLFLFLLGTVIGSFLNVVVYRSIHGQDWVRGRSRCEHCQKQLAWYENIPVFSYLLLRGKCSRCGTPIDFGHPLIELLTGALFLWWYLAGYFVFTLSSSPMQYVQPLFWLLAGVLAVVIFISDWRHMIIPFWAVAGLTTATLLYRVALIISGEMRGQDFWLSMVWSLALAAFFWLLWWLTKKKGFGFGDVQLAIPLGLMLGGWQRIVVAVFLAFLLGAAVGIGLLVAKRKKFGQAIAFGPFLLIGTALSLLWGYEIWAGYARIIMGTAL